MDLAERVRVVLVTTSHPGNIGAAARAMLTMGLTELVLVQPREFPHDAATARASGATAVLDRARMVGSLAEAIEDCGFSLGFTARPREFAGRVAAVREGCLEIVRYAASGRVALVFGSEMSGLSNAELALCTMAATIPANPAYASLNLAAAVQVAAYEVRMAAGAGSTWDAPRFAPATSSEIEALYAHAGRTLVAMNFLNPKMPRRLLPRLRRLFGRSGLEKEEVNILRGILARVDELTRAAGE